MTEQKPLEQPFVVFIPGADGGGRKLTAIRSEFESNLGPTNVFVPSSISRRQAYPLSERVFAHSRQLAGHIIDRSGDKSIRIMAHSLGGSQSEAIALLQEMLDMGLAHRHIDLDLISYPVVAMGLAGTVSCFNRVIKTRREVASVEQHVIYPAPETLYEASPVASDVTLVIRDTPADRDKRRQEFRINCVALAADPKESQLMFDQLDSIDEKLAAFLEREQGQSLLLDKLLKERANIIKPVLARYFNGDQLHEDLHVAFERKYGEEIEGLRPLWQVFPQALLYLARSIGPMYQGYPETLRSVCDRADAKGIDIAISLVVQERDHMFRLEEIERAIDRFEATKLPLAGVTFIEQLAHSSIGYYPQPFIELAGRRSNP